MNARALFVRGTENQEVFGILSFKMWIGSPGKLFLMLQGL